ncbi:MAG TPA: tryptophan--tRNA ligase [Acidimicrobiales bacterium]|nr:tryptophan--tRNA ligase [Acidimicrobiales bacterium]
MPSNPPNSPPPGHRVLSGIQPTGEPHLGNLLGAVRWWVADQREGDCFYCVVDLHGLTVAGDPAERRQATMTMATLLLAAGLDPDSCTLFVQSHVPAHTQLAWLLECTASIGELRRMTQFKDKSAKGGEEAARVGLFTYPLLMAADILLYDADRVPVGDDQRQHLELTRDVAQRFNTRYGDTFVVPEPQIPPPGRGARIMNLQEPARKMSKTTDAPQGVIGLFDTPKEIERKIKRAVTDTDDGPDAVRYDPVAKPGVSNLLELLATIEGRRPEDVAGSYTRYGPLKADVAAAVIGVVEPIQARFRELSSDPDHVMEVLRTGAARADKIASATLARAYEAVGLLPRL